MDSFEAWTDFRKGESFIVPPACCAECGGVSEGNVSIIETNESICDKCHEEMCGALD